MRTWFYFIAFIFFLGCVSNTLNRRKYGLVDSFKSDSLAEVLATTDAGTLHCMVREYNFLDTCQVKFVKQLHMDTSIFPLSERLGLIRLEDAELTNKIRAKTQYFYKEKRLKTEWLELDAPLEQFYVFANQVKDAYTYGLNPAHYHIDDLEASIQRLYLDPVRTADDVSSLDIRITGSFFLFTTHLIEGRIPTEGNDKFIWMRDKPREDDIQLLLSIKSEDQMKRQLEALHPVHTQYRKLKEALSRYRRLAYDPRSKEVSLHFSGKITPGERHSAIPWVRNRMRLTDLKEQDNPNEDSLLYDDGLVSAVKQFQFRHGLLSDGIIGPNTVKQLNIPLRKKADLITLNLERLRWLPNDFPDDYISINVPEYKLQVYNRDKSVLDMRVVTGSSFTSTPVFSDTLEYIVFSPTWTVPYSIIENEIFPRLRKDSLYYQNKNYLFYRDGAQIEPSIEPWDADDIDVFRYKVVQQPGASNALGLVKFIMPNNMYIYLHDTPADRLFERSDRALSHGCIRLEDPVRFSRYLLDEHKDWDTKKIIDAMHGTEPETVYLKKPFHVQIEYRSVWVDDTGLVHFRPDIYGHDERQLQRLQNFIGVSDLILH